MVLVSQTGCYILYPRDLPRKGKNFAPDPVDGAQVVIRSELRTTWRECLDSDIEKQICYFKKDKWRRDIQTRWYWAEYNGQALKRRELFSLVDPNFDKKVQKIRDMKGVCRISLIPTVLSFASFATSVFINDSLVETGLGLDKDQQRYISIGGAIAGVALAAASYPLGGYKCLEARRVAGESVGDGGNQYQFEWTFAPEELAPLVEDFNNRVRNGGVSPSVEPDAEPTDTLEAQ